MAILYWMKKVQFEFYLIFEAILSPRAPGAPFWAPFMYVEICRRVIFFTLKHKIEVLDDISPCRSRKPGFFKFSSRSPAILQFWELRFELRSLKNATIVKFKKKWKFYVFIISAKNASVLTYGRLAWNGIRFLTMANYTAFPLMFFQIIGKLHGVSPNVFHIIG